MHFISIDPRFTCALLPFNQLPFVSSFLLPRAIDVSLPLPFIFQNFSCLIPNDRIFPVLSFLINLRQLFGIISSPFLCGRFLSCCKRPFTLLLQFHSQPCYFYSILSFPDFPFLSSLWSAFECVLRVEAPAKQRQ